MKFSPKAPTTIAAKPSAIASVRSVSDSSKQSKQASEKWTNIVKQTTEESVETVKGVAFENRERIESMEDKVDILEKRLDRTGRQLVAIKEDKSRKDFSDNDVSSCCLNFAR